jgi:hypothetical protein
MTSNNGKIYPPLQNGIIRESNLELLRLVCMYYIVVHHILIHALHQVAGYGLTVDLSKYTIISTILDSFLFVAVNSFILISGFFSIRLKMSKLIHIYILCAAYGALFYFLHLYLDGQSIGRTFLKQSLFAISHSDLWFIQSYFFLCLLSPLLNGSIDYMNKKQHLSVIIALTFLNVYFGFVWQNPINPDGYNVMNFIFIYVIGQYIKKYISIQKLTEVRNKLIFLYIVMSVVFGLWVLFVVFILKRSAMSTISWSYNNPVIIISAIMFFCVFLTFNFRSKKINWLATSTIAVYIIQENRYFRLYIHDVIISITNHSVLLNDIVLMYLLILLFALLFMIACLLFDKVLQKIISPVERLLIFLWAKIEAKYNIPSKLDSRSK